MLSLKRLDQIRQLHVTSSKGFSLVVAILAILILTALGYLVVMMSTQDSRVSARVVGEKKAMAAAETGIQQLMADYDPLTSTFPMTGSTADPTSTYTIAQPAAPATGPAIARIPGYSVGRYLVYVTDITGTSSKYNSTVNVQAGINSMDPTCLSEYELCR